MHKLSSIVLFSLVILYNRIKIYMYKEGSVPMKTKLTYFGHACFMLTRGDVSMIFDPFLTGNTWDIAKKKISNANISLLAMVTMTTMAIQISLLKQMMRLVISTAEVAGKAAAAGCRTHAMHLGGKFDFEFGSVRIVPAFHGAGIPGGHAAGCIVDFYGDIVYFAGDTALFSDMKLLNRFGDIDYALLPIGDNFTMGVEDAALCRFLCKSAYLHSNSLQKHGLLSTVNQVYLQA